MELYFPPLLDEYFLFLHFHYFLFIDQESLNKENKVSTIRLTTAYIIPHFDRYRLETTVEAIIIKIPDIVKSLIDNFILNSVFVFTKWAISNIPN